jgi:hypothetical protein
MLAPRLWNTFGRLDFCFPVASSATIPNGQIEKKNGSLESSCSRGVGYFMRPQKPKRRGARTFGAWQRSLNATGLIRAAPIVSLAPNREESG